MSVGSTDVLLSIATVDWALECGNQDVCAAVYRGRVRLTDNRMRAILAAGDCQYVPEGRPLTARDGVSMEVAVPVLDDMFRDAASGCADMLEHELFGFYGK